ncbi:MAG: hypothetical protein ABW189_03185 [Rickettsiales bacterium]
MASARRFDRAFLRPFLCVAAALLLCRAAESISLLFSSEEFYALAEENGAATQGQGGAKHPAPASPPAAAPVESSPHPDENAPERVDLGDIDGVKKELLENLNQRRKELDEWSRSVAMKENVLSAAELKISRKLEELRALKTEVERILELYKEKENVDVARMVKIYENMPPKDAGRIFEQIDENLLIDVLSRMREQKAAPVMAAMNPALVGRVTQRILTRRRLESANLMP